MSPGLLDRLAAPAVARQELREVHCDVPREGGRGTGLPVHGDRALHVVALFQQLRITVPLRRCRAGKRRGPAVVPQGLAVGR
ncbi:hypothetical protein [Streptomyces wedmorensis]